MDRNTLLQTPTDTIFSEWLDIQCRLRDACDLSDQQYSVMCERIYALEDQIAAAPSKTVRDCMMKIAVIHKDGHITSAQHALAMDAWKHLGFDDLLFADQTP